VAQFGHCVCVCEGEGETQERGSVWARLSTIYTNRVRYVFPKMAQKVHNLREGSARVNGRDHLPHAGFA